MLFTVASLQRGDKGTPLLYSDKDTCRSVGPPLQRTSCSSSSSSPPCAASTPPSFSSRALRISSNSCCSVLFCRPAIKASPGVTGGGVGDAGGLPPGAPACDVPHRCCSMLQHVLIAGVFPVAASSDVVGPPVATWPLRMAMSTADAARCSAPLITLLDANAQAQVLLGCYSICLSRTKP